MFRGGRPSSTAGASVPAGPPRSGPASRLLLVQPEHTGGIDDEPILPAVALEVATARDCGHGTAASRLVTPTADSADNSRVKMPGN